MNRIRLLVCTLPLFVGFTFLAAQNLSENGPYYLWFDNEVGIENTGIYEGVLYKELYRTLNQNTQFYTTPDFLSGSVVYNGQPYIAQLLEYNVYEDQVLIKVPDRLGGNTIQLIRDNVSEFTIDKYNFIRVSDAPEGSAISGFYEVSYQNSAVKFLTRHTKKLFERKDRSTLYYEFLDGKKEYVVFYREQYYPIKNKRDLIEVFPGLKDQIDDFYNRAREQRRTQPHAFMIAIFTRIGSLLPQQNSNAF
jgi:hypothetical protein